MESRPEERADELDGVLWSYRTTTIGETSKITFPLAYGVKAITLAEVVIPSLHRSKINDVGFFGRNRVATRSSCSRIQDYKHLGENYYNKKVCAGPLKFGDLVLQKVYVNTKE